DHLAVRRSGLRRPGHARGARAAPGGTADRPAVGVARARPAHRPARLHRVRRAGHARRAAAGLVGIADRPAVGVARARAAHRPARLHRVRRAGHARRPAAGLVGIADRPAVGAARARAAHRPARLHRVRRAGRARRPAAGFVGIADGPAVGVARTRPALGPARLYRVGRARGAGARAELVRVADGATVGIPRAGAADDGICLEAVGRAGRARARAGLGHVARTRSRAAGRARIPRRVLAGDARAVALVERAGVAGGGSPRAGRLVRGGGACAPRRTLTIGSPVGLRRSPPTHEAAGLHHVGRAAGARPRAHLVGITEVARARAAQRPPVPRRVLTGVAPAVALVQRAGVAVGGARGAACLRRVRGTWATRHPGTIPRDV